VNSAPRCSGHAGGMTDLMILQGGEVEGRAFAGFGRCTPAFPRCCWNAAIPRLWHFLQWHRL